MVGQTAAVPGLPLITSPHTSPGHLLLLRQALREIAQEPVSQPLLIEAFTEVPRRAYGVITLMKEIAQSFGVSELTLQKTA